MDISSSEDEISTDVFKEAIDQQFLNDNLYNTAKLPLIPQSSEHKTYLTLYLYYFINSHIILRK